MKSAVILLAYFLTGTSAAIAADDNPVTTISNAAKDTDGFLVHTVASPFQADPTEIKVLLPDHLDEAARYPVVYVLPVEPHGQTRYGDGLIEVKKNDLHNKHGAIFVAPTFSALPWYADHPTNREIRQESHFLKVVLPAVEKTYPVVAGRRGRLLLGFSKSGWGAWSLLLRHPDTFSQAVAWDAPIMMEQVGKYGTREAFGTQENFDKYRVTEMLRENTKKVQGEKRLILTGYGNFREHHRLAHELLNGMKIPHAYRDGPSRKHDWHSGWVSEAVELLIPSAKR